MAEHELNKIVDDDGEVFNLRDSTKQPVADRVTSWGSTPSDTKYPSEKLVKDSLDAISTNARTIPQDLSKGANLVVNGCGTMCNNYNWPDFEWVGDYAVNSSVGSFKRSYSVNDNSARVCTEFIQVDPNKKVEISVDINVLSALVACDIRMTIFFYDIDKKLINAQSIMYGAGTLTELTQDLNPGDTVIHLSSVANWTKDIGQTYKRGFIFWDYQNSFGYTYPPETYSWHYYTNWFDSASDVDATTNTITLNKPWDGPKKLAGTKLSKCDSGGTYNYVSAKNVKTTELGQWFHLSGLVSGVATSGDNPVSKFRQGTAFIKVGFVNGTANANYTYLFTNFRVYELPTRLSFARDIRVNLGSETAASFDGSANVSPGINGTLAIAHGGTGATTKKGAEYAINGGMAEATSEPQNDYQFVFSRVGSDQSATNGVFLFRKASLIWSWIKGKLSSDSGVNISGSSASCTGNAATATAFSSGTAKTKFDGIAEGATKVEASTTNGKVKINGTDTTVYTHPSQTAYTSKGTSTKVPQITTDSTGHVTGITEVTISGVTPASHTHGNIQNGGVLQTNDITIASGDKLVVTDSSDSNKVARASVSFDGSTTTKALTQKGTFETFLTSHQDISGKMNTSASNATAPSSSGGDGATATLLNNLTDGNSDIVTTDNGDNVLIATTDNGGSVTNKWYKRKLVKLIPWIIKKLGTRLVYDCGAGSTSGDDFDAALAAFNAGQWVIIHDSANVYYCAGTYNSGLRFKRLTNSASGISVNTLNWTRGSSPSAGSQLDASLSGHTHTRSDITNFAHTHGNIQDSGALQTSDVTIASGDKLVITDSSDSSKVARASASFDGSTTTKALTQKGTFETFMTPSAGNAASGALQNLTGQLTEGTSDFTDNTEMFTSYAGNNGFAESGHVNQPYRRKASSMLNYIESKRFYTRNPADTSVGIGTKRIQLGYALKTGAGYCNYLVHVFFNSVAGSLAGCGVTLLVNYDWNTNYQKAKCVILNDNGLRAAGYNIVLANFLSNDGTNQWMHITLGLVENSEPGTLIGFAYSYCGIFRVNSDVNWVPSIASDTVGSYDQLVQAVLTDADTVDGYHIQFGSYSSRSDTISFY